jgi:hypothetical protein
VLIIVGICQILVYIYTLMYLHFVMQVLVYEHICHATFSSQVIVWLNSTTFRSWLNSESCCYDLDCGALGPVVSSVVGGRLVGNHEGKRMAARRGGAMMDERDGHGACPNRAHVAPRPEEP